jgi:hypothetical protein
MSETDDLDPTPEELAAAEALRKALDAAPGSDSASNDDADFLRSLKAAHSPAPLDAATNDALVAKALARRPKKKSAEQRGVVIRVAFGVAAALAVAAALFLIFGKLPTHTTAEPVALVRVRSTQPLFDKPFDTKDSSARVDRIAMARASDLRENRFAQWGVR